MHQALKHLDAIRLLKSRIYTLFSTNTTRIFVMKTKIKNELKGADNRSRQEVGSIKIIKGFTNYLQKQRSYETP